MSKDRRKTPYRKGLAAGRDYLEARKAYLDQGGYNAGLQAPQLPSNPYPSPMSVAYRNFAAGVRIAIEEAERLRRCGGKPPSWKY